MTEFTVLGDPRGKGRPRFTRNGGLVYTDSETKAYERKVRQSFLAAGGTKIQGHQVAIRAIMSIYYPIPQSWPPKKQREALAGDIPATCKPDADNVSKAVLDALNGYAYEDDKQVVFLHAEKYYSTSPRVDVVIMADMEWPVNSAEQVHVVCAYDSRGESHLVRYRINGKYIDWVDMITWKTTTNSESGTTAIADLTPRQREVLGIDADD